MQFGIAASSKETKKCSTALIRKQNQEFSLKVLVEFEPSVLVEVYNWL